MRLVDEVVIDKFIQSLEEDKEKWYKTAGGAAGHTITSYHSPEYQSQNGRTVSFKVEDGQSTVYVNGLLRYTTPFSFRINIFNKQSRRLRKGISQMISHINTHRHMSWEGGLFKTIRETVIPNE